MSQGGAIKIDNAVVSDTQPSLLDGQVAPLSLTNDGRLRVSTVPARIETAFFEEEHYIFGPSQGMFSGSPWSGL